MKQKKLQIVASVIMMIHNVMLAFWGILLWPFHDHVPKVSSDAFLKQSWGSIKTSNGQMAALITHYMRFWGIEGLLIAVLIAILTVLPYRKGERWAWISTATSRSRSESL